MPTNEQLAVYANILLTKGLNLQKGQILVVNAPVESSAFVTILTKEAYTCGASQVVCNWRCDDTTRLRYEYESQEQFETFPDWRREFSLSYYRQNAAFLSLISANPYLMSVIDTKKIFAWQKAQNEALKEYIDGMMASKTTWLVAAVPSKVWASILYPQLEDDAAYNALWNQILQSSRADGADPLADWDAHLANLAARRQWMTEQHFSALRYTNSLGTDLTIRLPEKHIWQGGAETSASGISFNANIPTEEIYTAPCADGVDGVVYSTKPLVYNGNVIDKFRLVFKDGKVVEAHAETGDDVLQKLVAIDEGAGRLGEVALIPYHSPISLSNILFYETLFDENASCHLALGASYPTCLAGGAEMTKEETAQAGLNDSMIHVDFMVGSPDLSITGIKADGSEVPVFLHGDWAE
ncbi:aminopeptidase [Megasphaera sp. An286]|uniref:aminopeptidase n=1 Tax=Megasphaera sp. An286 TaxID=1965622 RepID=UPI000B3BB160|nr:aminopeptidase [Megasphaera sp. An286]OUO48309.1 aminopeptidase [Megasphaera sp. An286]